MIKGDVVRTYAAIVLVGVAGIATASVKSIIIGTYVRDFAQSQAQAGYLLSAEMLAATAGVIASTMLPNGKLLVGALAAIFVGDLGTALLGKDLSLYFWQVIAGLGHGFALGRFASGVATVDAPQRITGIYGVSYLVLSSLVSVSLPNLKLALGGHALFVMLALVGPLALLGVRWFPTVRKGAPHLHGAGASKVGLSLTAFVAATLLLWYVSIGGYFPYMGQFGGQAGISFDDRTRILGTGQLFGLIGISLAIFVGNRFGSLRPLLLFISIQVFACALFLFRGTGIETFAASVWLYVFGWLAGLPFLLGLLSSLDRSGRLNALVNIMGNAAYAIGPAGAGLLLRSANTDAIGLRFIQIVGLALLIASGSAIIGLAVFAARRSRSTYSTGEPLLDSP